MAEENKKSTYVYKGYNPKNSKHVQKYDKSHYKRTYVRFPIQYYNEVLQPLCDSLGVTVPKFAKDAIEEKINRMNLETGSKI